MNFINVSLFKRAQIILRINAFLLFLFIIATPYLIKEGVWEVSESTVEGLFLAIEIGVLIRLFKAYDFHSNKNDRKANQLSGQLEEQKELSVDTLKYLGKMNVQISIIRQLVKKFKAPAEKTRLEYTMNEMLQTIAGLLENEKISLRIVDLDTHKTISETSLGGKSKSRKIIKNISNESLCSKAQKNNTDNLHIISSEHDNFSLKTFVFVEKFDENKNYKIDNEQFEIVQDMVNQCEVMYLLFNSEYHK